MQRLIDKNKMDYLVNGDRRGGAPEEYSVVTPPDCIACIFRSFFALRFLTLLALLVGRIRRQMPFLLL